MNEQDSSISSGQEQKHAQPLLFGFVAVLVVASIFLIGLGLGYGIARWTGDVGSGSVQVGGGQARRALRDEIGIFWEALDLVYRDYYGELPDDQDAAYGAIRGVLNQLDDPNTSFMEPVQAEFFRSGMQGSFEGIGARVNWDEDFDTVRIVEPYENQPAWNAGIRRDDLILSVDGESIIGTDLNEAVLKIRGPKGSVVLLNIAREGVEEPYDVEVTRDRIEMPTISTDRLGDEGQYAYVRLNKFSENAGELVRDAIDEAMDSEPAGIIFDLRGNTGGLVREAVKVTSVFLEDQAVLIERFSDGAEKTYETSGREIVDDVPVVVLVNGGSASASEIVAGAIQDAGRGTLIGTTTYGKGSVQLPHQLSDGSIMSVTIARWFTPNDRTIDGVGLTPDIEIEITQEQWEADEDPQLDEAIEFLSGQAAP